MAPRATLKTLLRTLLGTSDDDPAFQDTILDPIIQQAVDSLLTSIREANAGYLVKEAALVANSPSSHSYTLAGQSPAILDFAKWLEVRYTDDAGAELSHARYEELRAMGGSYFDITGPDESAVLVTSPDTSAGVPLWMRWSYWPAELEDDESEPDGIPRRFHDVVPLEALFAYGLGGEQKRPPELTTRWIDRRAQLIAHVTRRGTAPARTRILTDASREA